MHKKIPKSGSKNFQNPNTWNSWSSSTYVSSVWNYFLPSMFSFTETEIQTRFYSDFDFHNFITKIILKTQSITDVFKHFILIAFTKQAKVFYFRSEWFFENNIFKTIAKIYKEMYVFLKINNTIYIFMEWQNSSKQMLFCIVYL